MQYQKTSRINFENVKKLKQLKFCTLQVAGLFLCIFCTILRTSNNSNQGLLKNMDMKDKANNVRSPYIRIFTNFMHNIPYLWKSTTYKFTSVNEVK